ncbi:MAG: cysteine desulfurase NifS [Verrucomicrobiota bacterium]
MLEDKDIIYLDNNATTRVAPEVFETMAPWLRDYYGNPSSAYTFGTQVRDAVETARSQVAALLGCESREIFFTSCGTESDNAAINSALQITGHRHVITSGVEHSAVKNHAETLERMGYGVTFLPVANDGTLDPSEVEKAIRPDTAIVSLMWANNETGVLFPIREIAQICQSTKTLFHTDAVQCPGKIDLTVKDTGINYLSLSGHKLHAPKGVGVLYIRRRSKFVPYVMGGHQEKGKRGGTENVASIVGLGRAAELALNHLQEEATHTRTLRDHFENQVLDLIPSTKVNGHRAQRLPNTSNISFTGASAEAVLLGLNEHKVCASAGSACTTGSMQASHVLTAMGLKEEEAFGSVRFSFSHYNTQEEVDQVLSLLPDILHRVQSGDLKATPASSAATA